LQAAFGNSFADRNQRTKRKQMKKEKILTERVSSEWSTEHAER
jgi:hypothetical protein